MSAPGSPPAGADIEGLPSPARPEWSREAEATGVERRWALVAAVVITLLALLRPTPAVGPDEGEPPPPASAVEAADWTG